MKSSLRYHFPSFHAHSFPQKNHSTTKHSAKYRRKMNPSQTLSQITSILTTLLSSTLTTKTFQSRWQLIHSKLNSLSQTLTQISNSTHWSQNPLLLPILTDLLSTLNRIQTLLSTSPLPRGKLLMQSDLDMSYGWLTRLNRDLDLLIKSGVLHHSTAIVLSRPSENSSKDEISFYVKDLFARIQIGGLEFKKKALESLIELLLEDEKSASVVAKEGNIGCLVSLIDPNSNPGSSLTELGVKVVSLLVSSGEFSCKCVFEEGGLGPLLRVIESGSVGLKEKAAMAVECITRDTENAWAVSAYGGVSVLVEFCKSGSSLGQGYAVGAIRNVCSVEDIRSCLVEEGGIGVLVNLLVSGSGEVKGKVANCVAILASAGEFYRDLLLGEGVLERLLRFFEECTDLETLEHVVRAIYSLSSSDKGYRVLSGSSGFVVRISELVKRGNVMLQHICASLLANLSISEYDKRAVGGCMGSLVKLMECVKPDGMQEVGAKALLSLLLVKSNRKELVRDEKSLMRLMQMLDPKNEVVSKKLPIMVVAGIMAGGSQSCRKKLVVAGAVGHLQRLTELEVPGAKKALQRLSGNRLTSIFSRTFRE